MPIPPAPPDGAAPPPPVPASTRWQLLGHPGFAKVLAALACYFFAVQIQTTAVGWQVYDMTRDPFALGLIGLSQFAPGLLLFLVTGAFADRHSRRRIMGGCLVLMAVVSAGLLALTLGGSRTEAPILVLIVLFGAARAFFNPARQALVPNLVPATDLSRALALTGSMTQIGTICGPVAGGLLYGLSPALAYGSALALALVASALVLSIPAPAQRMPARKQDWQTLTAGIRFIRARPIILGAISLDLFVVILGGAEALLPVYARDVLSIGAVGLGLLRAAPAIGAIAVAFWLLKHPIRRNAGRLMFATTAGFALATFVFAVSQNVWLSVIALAATGGFDMISVLIRTTLIQLHTPDELRGRVTAVNQVFIGASNEMGAFRAGSMAALVGPVAAVAGGAVVAMGISALWLRLFPDLRRASSLEPPSRL